MRTPVFLKQKKQGINYVLEHNTKPQYSYPYVIISWCLGGGIILSIKFSVMYPLYISDSNILVFQMTNTSVHYLYCDINPFTYPFWVVLFFSNWTHYLLFLFSIGVDRFVYFLVHTPPSS